MSTLESHPSYLALDRAALGQRDEAIAAHLRACEPCRLHVARLAHPPPVPASVRALARPPWWQRLLSSLSPKPVAFAGLAGALAVAALVIALPGGRETLPAPGPVETTEEPAYLAAKGLAAVAVWVKHGDEVRLWDGIGPVEPGDRIQLELEPGPYRWFALLAETGSRLAEGDLEPERRFLVPTSFVLDEAPGAERLVMVLAAEPLERERLEAARAGEVSTAKVIHLVIPKKSHHGATR